MILAVITLVILVMFCVCMMFVGMDMYNKGWFNGSS